MTREEHRRSQSGFSLVAAVAGITIMLILMGAAVPSWRYVMKDMREEELLFRGVQIAEAIERYQKKNGGTTPPSLDVLVKGKYLRKLYKDPMTKDGKWRLIRQGEMVAVTGAAGPAGVPAPAGGSGPPGAGAPSPSPSPSPSASPSPDSFGSGGPAGGGMGPIVGVASTSKEKSLKLFNGRSRYDQWLFIAGAPRVRGAHPGTTPTIGGSPGPRPTPSVAK